MRERSVEILTPEAPTGAPDGLRPEVADVARLGRWALRGVLKRARADETPSLGHLLHAHLGEATAELPVVEESWRAYDHVNVQAGLEVWLQAPGRDHHLVGVSGFQHREFGLADLLASSAVDEYYGLRPGNVASANLTCGPDEVRPCVLCGIYLIAEPQRRTAILLRGAEQHGARQAVTLQVVSTDPGAAAAAAGEIRRLALECNVFRGQVVSFGGEVFDPGQALLHVHHRPTLDRTDVILPTATLDAVERQVIGVSLARQRLLAAGQHLKRGVLLYGPPGTGKTHTVRYLLSRLTGTTVIQLTGAALHLVAEACSVARALQPAMVVVEDVDLIAEDRGVHPGGQPLLFELLNEMDGLGEDADVVFVLTTNRADLLEPALAARPGRVDQAVALDLPDEDARWRLLQLYRGRLVVDDSLLQEMARRTGGVTASFLKELMRRAALLAVDGGPDRDDEPITLTVDQVNAALDELQHTRNAMTRVLLGADTATDAAADPRGDWRQL